MKLILDIKQTSDLKVLVPLLERLGISFSQDWNQANSGDNRLIFNQEKPLSREEARQIIEEGCEFKSFGDPVEFQRKQRNDRPLPFRTE